MLTIDELVVGKRLRWKGQACLVEKVTLGCVTLSDATEKRTRIRWPSAAWIALRKTIEDQWALARSHCEPGAAQCFWCSRGFDGGDRESATYGMQWRDD